MIASWANDDVDLIMGSQKSLCLPGRFEPPHQFLSFARGSVRAFGPIVQAFVRPVIGMGCQGISPGSESL